MSLNRIVFCVLLAVEVDAKETDPRIFVVNEREHEMPFRARADNNVNAHRK